MDSKRAVAELEETQGNLLPWQKRFLFAPEKEEAIAGGFASGKSHIGVYKGLMLSAIFPGNEGMLGRFRGTDLEDSIKPLFFQICPPSWIKTYRNKTSGNFIELKNTSKIYFRHIHDATGRATKSRRLGMNLGWFLLDQMEEMEKPHYLAALSRLRHPKAKRHFAMGNFNPNGHDWIYEHFFPRQPDLDPIEMSRAVKLGDRLGIMVNSESNRASRGGFVADSSFDTWLDTYPPEWIARYLHCSFRDFSGKIYQGYTLGSAHNVVRFPIPRHWDIIVGIDVGGYPSPWAVIAIAVDEQGNLIVFDELVAPNLTTAQVAAWIKSHVPWNDNRTSYVIDYENKLAMLELGEYGIHAQPALKSVLPGLIKMQGMFHVSRALSLPDWYYQTQPKERVDEFAAKQKGSPRFFIQEHCAITRKDHDEYIWDENKKNEPKKTNDRRFDTCDACRYVGMRNIHPSKAAQIEDKYHDLRKRDLGSAQEWEALDKRIADRINRQKGIVREADVEEVAVFGSSYVKNFDYEREA